MTRAVTDRLVHAGLVPPGARTDIATLPLDPVPPSAGVARRFVAGTLGRAEPAQRDAAVLVTSELVTNAVIHSRTSLEVSVVELRDRVVLAVTDRDQAPLRPRTAREEHEGGRGLAVVVALADDYGTLHHRGGKTVWAVLRRGGSATAHSGAC